MHRPRAHLFVLAALALMAGLLVAGAGTALAVDGPKAADVTRHDQASRVDKAAATRFAKTWGAKANNRSWAWVRAHSLIPPSRDYGEGVRLSEVKWFIREYGRLRFARCSERWDYDEDPATVGCYGNGGENLLVERTRSGRLVASSFWVED